MYVKKACMSKFIFNKQSGTSILQMPRIVYPKPIEPSLPQATGNTIAIVVHACCGKVRLVSPSTLTAVVAPPVTLMTTVLELPFPLLAVATCVPILAMPFVLGSTAMVSPMVLMASVMRLPVSVMP